MRFKKIVLSLSLVVIGISSTYLLSHRQFDGDLIIPEDLRLMVDKKALDSQAEKELRRQFKMKGLSSKVYPMNVKTKLLLQRTQRARQDLQI